LTLALVVAAVMPLAGCGYHVQGRASTLPSEWTTIAIPAFVNRTTNYRVEQRFTQAVVREFLERTKYKVIQDENAADAVLHGEVLTLETSPVLFDATTGQVTTMLVTVHSKLSLTGRADQKVVYKNDDVVFRQEYQISGDVKTFFEEQNPALQRMAHDFASEVVANIVEGF
jgi:outer membrane lipopolysaccharide assembly protein LptE/RlpB